MGVFDRYKAGEFTSGSEWCEDLDNAWVLTEELKSERAVAQIGLDGEYYYKKVNPVIELTPEKAHLLRTDNKPKSVLPLQTRLINEPTDNGKLAIVRSEISQLIHEDGGAGLAFDAQSLNAGVMRE